MALLTLLRRNEVRLFLTSFAILFVELLLIRWIPSNVKYIGFFSNFLLIASFLGIGLGILIGRKGFYPRISPFALLLAVIVAFIFNMQLNVQIKSSSELFFGLAESSAVDQNFLILPLIVALVVALLATLALPLGPLLKSMPPLKAYAIDIIGSLAGIAGFTVLSALGTNPAVWFTIAVLAVLLLELGRKLSPFTVANVLALGAVLLLVFQQTLTHSSDIWSPYYRINETSNGGVSQIYVDGIPHQALHPLGQAGLEPFYYQVYKWFPGRTYDNVLIVGAGSGSDVAIAEQQGAGHIDAVEIDPKILQIGETQHPNHPYSDPRVTAYNNDGRAFLRNSDKKYDLIVFALPDSLTLVSQQSSVRLESFLFTEQAFQTVKDHLSDDGVFILYNYYRDPWLVNKLATMLNDAFGTPPLVNTYSNVQAALADGPLVAKLNGAAPPGDRVTGVPALTPGPTPRPATDDWPFLYLRVPFVADYYIYAIVLVLIGALIAIALAAAFTGTTIRKFSPHFFVLGVAFLLLNTRSVTSFSLLFGTTWIVNSLAFFGILCSVLLAIVINYKFPIRRPTPFYVLLFVSILVAFLVPPESLLFEPAWLRYLVAAGLAFAPIFFANLVFSYSFRETNQADMAFASNLLGAVVGGALEYLALVTGYQALLIVVAGLYALAWVFATRLRLGADRELSLDEHTPDEPALGRTPDFTPEPAG